MLSNQRRKGFHGFCFYVKISPKGLQEETHRQAQTCLQHVGEPLTAHPWHTDALHKSCFYCFFSILCELCSLRVRLIQGGLGWVLISSARAASRRHSGGLTPDSPRQGNADDRMHREDPPKKPHEPWESPRATSG